MERSAAGYSFPDMKTTAYILASPLRTIKLVTSRTACFINMWEVDRIEAANAIRYVRATNGTVSRYVRATNGTVSTIK